MSRSGSSKVDERGLAKQDSIPTSCKLSHELCPNAGSVASLRASIVTLPESDWIEYAVLLTAKTDSWRKILQGYHATLRKMRPILLSNNAMNSYFFSHYGPEEYKQVGEKERYLKRLGAAPLAKVVYIRLRINVVLANREAFIDSLSRVLEAETTLVSDFEVMKDYDVLGDLGRRFCRNERGEVDSERTRLFVDYWNSGCNYILSALGDSPNWDKTVDAMGMPHLMFNALGGAFRTSVRCQSCSEEMYLVTWKVSGLSVDLRLNELPLLPVCCSNCGRIICVATNL
jgi:hypothetical protein